MLISCNYKMLGLRAKKRSIDKFINKKEKTRNYIYLRKGQKLYIKS